MFSQPSTEPLQVALRVVPAFGMASRGGLATAVSQPLWISAHAKPTRWKPHGSVLPHPVSSPLRLSAPSWESFWSLFPGGEHCFSLHFGDGLRFSQRAMEARGQPEMEVDILIAGSPTRERSRENTWAPRGSGPRTMHQRPYPMRWDMVEWIDGLGQ